MTDEQTIARLQGDTLRAQAAQAQASASWLRAFGAPGWIVAAYCAAGDWWTARAEEAEK